MSAQEDHERREAYFVSRYEKVTELWFAGDRVQLRDHESEAERKCRFCDRGRSEATFTTTAHAVADFLGNRSIISMNECDECNTYFGTGCEDHLSKATLLHRTLASIPRKRSSSSTFKDREHDETLRIDSSPGAVNIRVSEPNSVDDLLVDGELPEKIPLRGDLRSQPYAPIEALKALIKFACSICPASELDHIRSAIDWVRGRCEAHVSACPVGFAFTPGAEGVGEKASHVILLRRKDDGPEPYLWFIVQFRNFRYQVPVPFCPNDDCKKWSRMEHFQSLFTPSWSRGETIFRWENWSGAEKGRVAWSVSHHRSETVSITRPPGQQASTASPHH